MGEKFHGACKAMPGKEKVDGRKRGMPVNAPKVNAHI
jgi:hypothetical protein